MGSTYNKKEIQNIKQIFYSHKLPQITVDEWMAEIDGLDKRDAANVLRAKLKNLPVGAPMSNILGRKMPTYYSRLGRWIYKSFTGKI